MVAASVIRVQKRCQATCRVTNPQGIVSGSDNDSQVAFLAGRLSLVALVSVLTAQTAAQPTFRAGVDLVTIPVVVTATDGSRIGDLGPADFRLREDGVLQQVTVVNRNPRPVSVCILLDSSPSMAGREAQATRAIDTILAKLNDDDEVALLMFASNVRVALPWTRARDARRFSWRPGWRLYLGTALLDAMKDALALVDGAANPLPVIVIVSDGGEMSSGMQARDSGVDAAAERDPRLCPPDRTTTIENGEAIEPHVGRRCPSGARRRFRWPRLPRYRRGVGGRLPRSPCWTSSARNTRWGLRRRRRGTESIDGLPSRPRIPRSRFAIATAISRPREPRATTRWRPGFGLTPSHSAWAL